jgi:hypothetical protein
VFQQGFAWLQRPWHRVRKRATLAATRKTRVCCGNRALWLVIFHSPSLNLAWMMLLVSTSVSAEYLFLLFTSNCEID